MVFFVLQESRFHLCCIFFVPPLLPPPSPPKKGGFACLQFETSCYSRFPTFYFSCARGKDFFIALPPLKEEVSREEEGDVFILSPLLFYAKCMHFLCFLSLVPRWESNEVGEGYGGRSCCCKRYIRNEKKSIFCCCLANGTNKKYWLRA